VLPGLLCGAVSAAAASAAAGVAGASEAGRAFGRLAAHPALEPYLEALCTDGHHRGVRSLGSGPFDRTDSYDQDGADIQPSFRL
jgi:hypothetical protein